MILHSNQLTPAQFQDVLQLSEHCALIDKGLPVIYHHLLQKKRNMAANLLYYSEDKLVGFLSVYFFYENACEISLLVAPTYRCQGVASKLLKTIWPLLETTKMITIIFSSASTFGHDWFPQKNLNYTQTEYHMVRNSYETILLPTPTLKIRKAILSDIEQLTDLDMACFFSNKSKMLQRLTELLVDHNYTILVAEYGQKLIGKAHIQWSKKQDFLSDIAILPAYQKQGFGSELVAVSINHILNTGQPTIELDVETKNENALNLYKKYGFKITTSIDFWTILTKKLMQLI